MQYQLINGSTYIKVIEDDGTVRFVPDSLDSNLWQAYQQWLTELDENGNPNQPLPAE